MSHDTLVSHVGFDLMQNNYYTAGGSHMGEAGMHSNGRSKVRTCIVFGDLT